MGRWEEELGQDIEDDWWDEALTRVNSTSSRARLSFIQFKVLHRINFTKARLSRLFPGTSDSCERCNLSPADHTHVFLLL